MCSLLIEPAGWMTFIICRVYWVYQHSLAQSTMKEMSSNAVNLVVYANLFFLLLYTKQVPDFPLYVVTILWEGILYMRFH